MGREFCEGFSRERECGLGGCGRHVGYLDLCGC